MEDDKTVNIDDIEKEIAKSEPQVCPHCGRCPVCGGGSYDDWYFLRWPLPDYLKPFYPPNYPFTTYTWSGAAGNDITTYTA